MKKSELKAIIRECIEEELYEGLQRNRRTLVSKNPGATAAFKRGIKKAERRNKSGIEKYGQVNFANRRLRNMNHDGSFVNSVDNGGRKRYAKKDK